MPKLPGWRPAPESAARSPLDGRRLAFWYGVFAVSAGILYLLTTQPEQRTWGAWAAGTNLLAVLVILAWPRGRDVALAIALALIAARDGVRAAVRFAAVTVVTAVALTLATAPAALATPDEILQNVVLYPLGMTRIQTPAASPLPGHLLAESGPAGHLAAVLLVVAAGLMVAASLVLKPPVTIRAAAFRLALGLTLLLLLAPASWFGYFVYPLTVLAFALLAGDETMPDSQPSAERDSVAAVSGGT